MANDFPSPSKHLVFFPLQVWGHARSMCAFVARVVQMHPVIVTFLAPITLYDRVKAEVSRSLDKDYENLRIIALPQHENPMVSDLYEGAFAGVWDKLASKEPVTCAKTGQTHAAVPVVPQAAVIDFFAPKPVAYLRKAAPKVKAYTWYPSATFSGLYLFGPESIGGKGHLLQKIEEEAARTGKPFDAVACELFGKTEDVVVKVPGLPPMYDYEYHPQSMPLPPVVVNNSIIRAYDVLSNTDGIITMGPEALEPEAAAWFRSWVGERSKPVYFSGPLVPDGEKAAAAEQSQSPFASEIQAFLDRQLETRGEQCVVYISFGSLFFPLKPEIFAAFLDVVMEQNIPFIVSHPSPFAVIPDELKKKVDTYGHGLFSQWSPQQTILRHRATGWFLSHAGFNGTMEAITAGVPMICWPCLGDQPTNAIHLTETLDTGYELFEVRTGHGLRPIYRNGKTPTGSVEAVRAEAIDVLSRAFGEEGKAKRARLLALKERIDEAWKENGASRRDVEAFLDSFAV